MYGRYFLEVCLCCMAMHIALFENGLPRCQNIKKNSCSWIPILISVILVIFFTKKNQKKLS